MPAELPAWPVRHGATLALRMGWLGFLFLALAAPADATDRVHQRKRAAKLARARKAPIYSPKLSKQGWPDISARSVLILDAKSRRVLWSKHPDAKRFPASTTKIMTALLLLETTPPDDVIVAPKDIKTVGGSSLHLQPGEKVSAHDLAYAILLRSANDACVAAAVHIAGSVEDFVKLMNLRAKEIGCKNTAFRNPNGLNDPQHLTSSRDLALIAQTAMQRSDFRDIVATQRYAIERSSGSKDTLLVSRNKLLGVDPTVDGIKTGWTNPAGECFVGSAKKDGLEVMTVILGSRDWLIDQKFILKWAFERYQDRVAATRGERLGDLPVGDQIVSWGVGSDISVAASSMEIRTFQWTPAPFGNLNLPIRSGDRIGDAVLMVAGKTVRRVPMLALNDVATQTLASKPSLYAGVSVGLAMLVTAATARSIHRRRTKIRL